METPASGSSSPPSGSSSPPSAVEQDPSTATTNLIRGEDEVAHMTRSSFNNRQGLRLQCYTWEAAASSSSSSSSEPRAILVWIHGITSHAKFEFLNHSLVNSGDDTNDNDDVYRRLTYTDSWIERYNQMGITVCAFDQQGHGESESWKGSRCNVEYLEDLSFDVIQFMIITNQKINGSRDVRLPLFVSGVSMGGGVCLRSVELYRYILKINKLPFRGDHHKEIFLDYGTDAREYIDPSGIFTASAVRELHLSGAMVFCPNLSVESCKDIPINKVLLPLAGVASTLTPKLKVGRLQKNDAFPWIERDRLADAQMPGGVYTGKLPARAAGENLRLGTKVMGDASLLFDDCPTAVGAPEPLKILLVHSSLDTMCDPKGTEDLFAVLKPRVSDVEMILLPHSWHYLVAEEGNEKTLDSVVAWLEKRICM